MNVTPDKECFWQLSFHNSERTGDWIQIAVFIMYLWDTFSAMHARLSSFQRLVSIAHTHAQKTTESGNCIYHTEYVVVIQHKDASKPFQNLNTQLFQAFESSGCTYWGMEHLWFNKFSKYHCLRWFSACLYFFHLRTLQL